MIPFLEPHVRYQNFKRVVWNPPDISLLLLEILGAEPQLTKIMKIGSLRES